MSFFKRKNVKVVPAAIIAAREELFSAVAHRNRAMANFNNAEPEFFEIANNELTAANLAVDTCMRKIKVLEQMA
jgi:hypothetical protein